MDITAQNPTLKSRKLFGFKDLLKIIVNTLALFLVAVTGIAMLIEGHIIAGMFFLFLSLAVLIPQKYLKVTNFIKLILIGIVYIIFAAIFGKSMPKPEVKYENYDLGQEFTLDLKTQFLVSVKSVDINTTAKIGEEVLTTTGNFLGIRGTIINSGNSPEAFAMNKPVVLKDSQGRSFTMKGATVPTEAMQPGITNDFLFVFEVPKDTSDLTLEIKDKTDVVRVINL
jgi:hypothetical protein